MAYTADAVLVQWRTELGLGESPPGSNRNKVTAWYRMVGPWCDMQTVYEAFMAAGENGVDRNGRFAFTPWHAEWFRKQGRFGRSPRKGALVFYDWAGSRSIGAIDHVGIVEAVHSDGTFTTIEGNLGDRCQRVRRSMAYAVGFGYPNYDGSGRPPAGSSFDEFIRRGESGPEVLVLQRNLLKLGYKLPRYGADSDYGSETEAAVKRFQHDHDLVEDGEYGPKTAAAMKKALGLARPPAKPTTRWPYKADTVMDRDWHSSEGVRAVQKRLNELGARPKLVVDGDYGPKTEAAVRAFQRAHGLTVDGVVGRQETWPALF